MKKGMQFDDLRKDEPFFSDFAWRTRPSSEILVAQDETKNGAII
jgi:hypothetical protein